MRATITRPMTVMGDEGRTVSFRPSTDEKPFEEVSLSVFSRLKRAGAAVAYRERAKPEQEAPAPNSAAFDLDKATKAELIAYAEAENIPVDANAVKAVILEMIKAQLAKNAAA